MSEILFSPPKGFIWGDVILDTPLVGAMITICELDGRPLFEKPEATHETGSFLFKLPLDSDHLREGMPSAFRIVAQGGTLGNTPFTGTVVREVHDYKEGAYYKLNAITSLIAIYKRRHADTEYEQAEHAVAQFLKLPSNIDIQTAIDNAEWDNSIFSHAIFMLNARDAGEFDTYLNLLVDKLEAGECYFVEAGPPIVGIGWGEGLKFMGKGLANGVLSWGAGQAVGWVFHALGYRSPVERNIEEIKKELSAINERLEEQSKQLTEIQGTLHRLERRQDEAIAKIDHLTQRLEEVYEGLKEFIKWSTEITELRSRKSIILNNIISPVSSIKVTFDNLFRFAKIDFAKLYEDSEQREEIQALVSKTVDEILSPPHGIEHLLEMLHDNITGFLGEMGLIEVWSKLIALGATNTNHLIEIHNSLEERFTYLLAMEMTGISLMLDAYHSKFRNDTSVVEAFWLKWKAKLNEQLDYYLRCIEKVASSRIDNLTTSDFNNHLSVYSPSVILGVSDNLTQDVRNGLETGETTGGIITVRVVNYPSVTKKQLPTKLALELRNIETNEVYAATSVQRADGNTIPDRSFNNVQYELVYFNFSMPMGSYQLVKLDDQHPSLLRQFDYEQTATLTADHEYATMGITAYYDMVKPVLTAKWKGENRHNEKQQANKQRGESADDSRFDHLVDATTNTKGQVSVVDYTETGSWPHIKRNYHIQTFDMDRNLIHKWEASGGSEESQFGAPSNVAVDSEENVYVLDGHYVQKFNVDGKFMRRWGGQSAPWEGKEDGKFYFPSDITVDNAGNVYVADSDNLRIQKFDPNGEFLIKWDDPAPGKFPDDFLVVTDVAVDTAGNLYVVDTNNHRIQKFDTNGTFMLTWGSKGTDDGQFDMPDGIAIDTAGYVYVEDSNNQRIQKFDANGRFIREWGGLQVAPIRFRTPMVIDATGNLYVADTSNNRIRKFDPDGNLILEWGGRGAGDGQFEFDGPNGLALDTEGHLYAADSHHNRIEKFDTDGNFILKWGSQGRVVWGAKDGQFSSPEDVAVDAERNVYVVDSANHRIQKFDANGQFLDKWGGSGVPVNLMVPHEKMGIGPGQFDGPRTIAVDANSNVYVIDLKDRIQKFDTNGKFLHRWGRKVNRNFEHPDRCAIDASGNVYIADRDRIHKLDSNGTIIQRWGVFGNLDNEFHGISDLAVEPEGNVYVADADNHRIQKFDSTGKFILKWESEATGDGQTKATMRMTVSGNGDIYVLNHDTHDIQVFSKLFVSQDWLSPLVLPLSPDFT